MSARGRFRTAASGRRAGHAGRRFVWPDRSSAERPICAGCDSPERSEIRRDQLQAADVVFASHAANHGGESIGGGGIMSEGSRVSGGTTNFWIRWRVRVGYPVGIAAFWFARPQVMWVLCGVGVAFLGLLVRGCAAGFLRKHKQ